jgi:hypothetical protein
MHKTVATIKTPRESSSYRGARRNAARADGGIVEWSRSCLMAIAANDKAHLGARQVQANSAREAAAKAVVEAMANPRGLTGSIVGVLAMLDFYRGEKHTRPVNRIIRSLQVPVRGSK